MKSTFKKNITNYLWKRFSPSKPPVKIDYYVKIIYGLAGCFFLVYLAFYNSPIDEDNLKISSPPTSWIWLWTINESNEVVQTNNSDEITLDEELFNDDKPVVETADLPSWGTDRKKRDIKKYLGLGASSYLIFGTLVFSISIIFSLLWAILIEWTNRPKLPLPHQNKPFLRWFFNFNKTILDMIDSFPKFLLLLGIYAIGGLTHTKLAISTGIFLIFGSTSLFRSEISNFLRSEHYIYALELGLSPKRIFFLHLFKRSLLPLVYIQIPFMLCAYILYDATIIYLGWEVANTFSWGFLLKENYHSLSDWGFSIPVVSLLFVVSALYMLGDGLRSRLGFER